jgi:RNA polymerase sigma factor (sigma-70 family)
MTDGAAVAAEETDSELMARVRDGELERLSELFERHHRRLYGFFLRLSGDRSAAEDLVQEVFVRLLKYRHTFKSDAEFTPWMFTLARNAAVDSFRSRPKELQEDPEAPEPAAPATAAADHPDERLETRERAALLHAALRKLAPEKRELLLLARFGEMKYDSIGELLGISVGAVKVRVHRALKELRAAYRSVAGEEMA